MSWSRAYLSTQQFSGRTSRNSSSTVSTRQNCRPDFVHALRHVVRPEYLQNESSPNFSNFRPGCYPEFCSRIFPEFLEEFSCFIFVSWETETRKKSPKIPAIFQCKIPRQIPNKKSQNLFLGSGQSNMLGIVAGWNRGALAL